METSPQKNLERLISQKAMQMSNSFPCKIWALGFICGVCITYLFLVASTPFKGVQLVSLYASSPGAIAPNSSSLNLGKGCLFYCSFISFLLISLFRKVVMILCFAF